MQHEESYATNVHLRQDAALQTAETQAKLIRKVSYLRDGPLHCMGKTTAKFGKEPSDVTQ